jgi:hypothetical protein
LFSSSIQPNDLLLGHIICLFSLTLILMLFSVSLFCPCFFTVSNHCIHLFMNP